MNFEFDATADGRRLKFLMVIDEHSGVYLAIRVGRRCKATAPEAQILADRWRWESNAIRPRSALQGLMLLEAAQQGAAR